MCHSPHSNGRIEVSELHAVPDVYRQSGKGHLEPDGVPLAELVQGITEALDELAGLSREKHIV